MMHDGIQSWEAVVELGYSIVVPTGILFGDAPFLLIFCEGVQEERNRQFIAIMLLRQLCSTGII